MSKPNLEYLSSHRPYPRFALVLSDIFKVVSVVSTVVLIAILIVLIISSYTSIHFLSSQQMISANSAPLWLTLVPELIIIATFFLFGVVGFYIYNQMAYSGYTLGVLFLILFGVLGLVAVFGAALDRFPSLQLAFRGLESNVQKPMPSQSYFSSVMAECEKKGYYPGWVEKMSGSSITINQWGEEETFELEDGTNPLSQISVGQRVVITQDCTGVNCQTKIITMN